MPQSVPWGEVPDRSPFLKLLTDYMWSHRPPLTVGQLSYQTAIPKQTIWGWIREGRTPRPSVLRSLSDGTGIPLADLYDAVGYSLPGQERIERDPFLDMIARVQRDPRFSAASKQAIIDSLMKIEMGEAEAERQRMIYSEQHTTVESAVVTRDEAAVEADDALEDAPTAPLPVPPPPPTPPPTPQRSQRTSPRPRRRETPARSSPVREL